MERYQVVSIPTSFVKNPMKFFSDRGSGEAKLYVGQVTNKAYIDDFFAFDQDYKYMCSRSNLLDYLKFMKLEYLFHRYADYKGANRVQWDKYYRIISSMQDEEFLMPDFTAFVDSTRYYVRSDNKIFRDVLRSVTVPKLTNYVFEKDKGKKTIILNLDINAEYAGVDGELDVDEEETENEDDTHVVPKKNLPRNVIYYGVPGCGKSFTINGIIGSDEKYYERVVFHPDYSYADFVGQILPESKDGVISYPFKPGPFTRILKNAMKDPVHPYYLVIEEINRGNAPAIFGELFQLLDRDDGVSSYGITNSSISDYINAVNNREAVAEEKTEQKIRLPENLFIFASMNTADQNVFTLDTAFKRRWAMVNVRSDWKKCEFADKRIADTEVSWRQFVEAINDVIIDNARESIGSEDKRLGAYYVDMDELSDRRKFAEKVLMYLWNDVFKYNLSRAFKTDYRTLDELVEGFCDCGFGVFADSFGFRSSAISAFTGAELADDYEGAVMAAEPTAPASFTETSEPADDMGE